MHQRPSAEDLEDQSPSKKQRSFASCRFDHFFLGFLESAALLLLGTSDVQLSHVTSEGQEQVMNSQQEHKHGRYHNVHTTLPAEEPGLWTTRQAEGAQDGPRRAVSCPAHCRTAEWPGWRGGGGWGDEVGGRPGFWSQTAGSGPQLYAQPAM